jgi:hypothetical protein
MIVPQHHNAVFSRYAPKKAELRHLLTAILLTNVVRRPKFGADESLG